MKNYDLRGLSIGGRKAVIAVCLPDAIGKNYRIYKIYDVSDTNGNKIVIHFKDKDGLPLEHGDNFELFIIDLTPKEFDGINFSKEIEVAFCHENKDVLNGTPAEVFDRAHKPIPIGKNIVAPDSTGTGIIKS